MLKFIDNISLVFNCFCARTDKGDTKKHHENEFFNSIVSSGSQHKICILPVRNDFDLDDLYPRNNHVDSWSSFIVGKDKTYILANTPDCNATGLVNHKGTGILPSSIEQFLDPVWDRTLEGNQVQLFMMYDSKTYLLNSYALKNDRDQIIGACMFMRLVDSLPNTIFQKTSSMSNEMTAGCKDKSTFYKESSTFSIRHSFEGFKVKS